MINKNKLTKLLTKNLTRVPLILISFNYEDYKNGIEKNCISSVHPLLKGDEGLCEKLQAVVDYIRENYDMEDIV